MTRNQNGTGWFSDAWDSFKSGVSKVNRFAKDNKIVSRAGGALGALGVPYAGMIGKAGALAGYGLKGKHMIGAGKGKSKGVMQF